MKLGLELVKNIFYFLTVVPFKVLLSSATSTKKQPTIDVYLKKKKKLNTISVSDSDILK